MLTTGLSGSQGGWRPTDLPAWVERAAARHGVRALDLTPALVREAERGAGFTDVSRLNDIYLQHANR